METYMCIFLRYFDQFNENKYCFRKLMMNLMEKFTIKLKNPLEKYCLKMLHNLSFARKYS